MEGCAKLENFFTEEEILNLSNSSKDKIKKQFQLYEDIIEKLREENAESVAILEREQFRFEKETSAIKEQLLSSSESCSKLKSQISELEESLSSVQKQWKDLQKLHDSTLLESQSIKRDNEVLVQEKRILSEQLEKRRQEIDKMNDDVKSLLEQVTSANEAKFTAIASAEEAKLKESNLMHKVTRLEQEKGLLNRQIVDLNTELTQKNSEIHTLKREKSSNVLEMKNLLEERSDQLHAAQKKIDDFKELIEEKDARIESLAEKIRQSNINHSKAEEQFKLEINAQTNLIELHKTASEDNQKRVNELMSAFEEARNVLKESDERSAEMERHCQEVEEKCRLHLEQRQAEVLMLKEELKKSRELAKGLSQDKIEQLFPVAAATRQVLHSGMTLFDLYSQYTKLEEELIQEKKENALRTQELNSILAEIQEKTPFIQQKMLEFDRLNETITNLKSQQSVALANNEKLLEERNDAKRLCNLANRENMRLKSQVVDLNRQVQRLLKEVEEARGGCVKDRRDSFNEESEKEMAPSGFITADKVISRHLVTFRDIEELQLKNQQLLAAIRDLGQEHEEMEKKVSNNLTSRFEKEIANLSIEVADLQKKRAKQTEMLETIVRQRDMYRVLLTNQGFSDSFLGRPESSFTQQSSSFSIDAKEAKSALNQLQAEFDNYKKEKAENERMLNLQLDKMRSESSDLRVENAKLASQCEYSEERVKILQSNLQSYKKEYNSCKDKNRQHTASIIQHQQTIASLRQDMMQAQEKIAKADVAIENLKAERDLLKSVETRLLQEKESVVREQQHQSRMMAKLQAVQNNMERIDSETKRNLQHQVEKGEEQIAILNTKLENAHNEYRAAVDVWEKQRKDLQSKIDAEVERNRKTHEELVEAYSQMHGLKQELASTKSLLQSPATPEKEKIVQSQSRTPVKSGSPAPSTNEVKMLKEQLKEAQSELKAVQDTLAVNTKMKEEYLNMCKELELRVKEQDEINKHLKESIDSALSSNNEAKSSLEKKILDMEKRNRELMEENMKLSQNSSSQINELQKRIFETDKIIESFRSEAESARRISEQAREDCQNQVKLMQEIQVKYQNELLLHAEDVKRFTHIEEEHEKCSMVIEKLTEAKKSSDHALTENKESWLRQEEMMQRELKALKSKICDLEACNNNLHSQLELLATQMAALQSKNWDETPFANIQADLKDTHHLLQVIQFIKKEKEIAATQFDVAQSENVRLKLKVDQLTNELNSVRSELEEITSNAQAKAASEAQHAELLRKIERMNLLSESNNLLRMEKEALAETNTKLENQLHELQEKFQPLYEREKELSQNVDILSAENNALRSEVKSWQSRTNQLLEQSHKIGPQEYKNLMRDMEELKSQKARLAEELQRKQAEVSQLTAQVNSFRKDADSVRKEADSLRREVENVTNLRRDNENKETELATLRKDAEGKDKEIQKINEERAEHVKNTLQLKKIARKYKQLYDELKESYDALEVKSKALEASNQEQAAQEMQKKMSDSEKEVVELKEEINKQKQFVEQSKKEAEQLQSAAKEKEEKAKKLLHQFRQKYSLINREKELLVEEKSRLVKEIEECKSKISALSVSQEETVQLRSHSDAKIARLEKELKTANDLRMSERKQYDELLQKVSQQKPGIKSPIVGLGDRTSGGTEPLTANIKPITSPSTSGTASGLRHSPHPVSCSNRPTPTASIRPMAIGTSAPPTQTRMAAVMPTTATPQQSADEVISPSPSVAVPHAAVQPTPATATVAPNTIAVAVSPVISEVAPSAVGQEESDVPPMTAVHPTSVAVTAPATALVPPRIEIAGEPMVEPAVVDSPAPTTSVIVSPPATQTQVVTPTVKRPREEIPVDADAPDTSVKRIRMVSEGSQTNQQHPTSVVAPIVPAAPMIMPQSPAVCEPSTSAQPDTKNAIEDVSSPLNVNSASEEELLAPDAEILEDDKEEQIIEWETQEEQETKIDDEFEAEVMEEETISGEVDEDIEQMQGIDVRSPDDEDMTEEQPDDVEDMGDQPTSSDLDLLDSTSNMQMDADSNLLQSTPVPDQFMAPPAAVPLSVEPVASAVPSVEPVVVPISAPVQRTPVTLVPPRIERPTPGNRQHLTPFTIPGQGSNFEEGDDSIVPSTPTLYVPRRADGFAEAVSSPHVPQVRFSFSSSESSPTQQGLSQLTSQDGLGVDDTRMDLSQFDEGGRTVPSTPLTVSPPVEVIVPDMSSSLESAAASVSVSEIIVPTIKIETPDESSDTQKSEASDSVFLDASVKSETIEEKESGASELSGTSEGKEESTPGSSKTDEPSTAEGEQNSKSSSAPGVQRKPIVWTKQSSQPEPAASESPALASGDVTQNPPGQSLLPTPPRGGGRTRARRGRFATSASPYSRGRGGEGATTWSPRRGRASRRRPMY